MVARGVRLHGRLIHRRVSWGQVDRLLPAAQGQTVLAARYQRRSRRLDDRGRDSVRTARGGGGRRGQADRRVQGADRAPPREPRCRAVHRDRPARGAGGGGRSTPTAGERPLELVLLDCPDSQIAIAQPRFDIDSRFSEAFDRYNGRGRIERDGAGRRGQRPVGFNGDLTFGGQPTQCSARSSSALAGARMEQLTAARTGSTAVIGSNAARGQITSVADYRANGVDSSRAYPPAHRRARRRGGHALEPITAPFATVRPRHPRHERRRQAAPGQCRRRRRGARRNCASPQRHWRAGARPVGR